MTAGPVTDSPAPSSTPHTRPSRLLTQLRTYTQNHISPASHRSYRDSITRAVGLSTQRLADLAQDTAAQSLGLAGSNTSAPENSGRSESQRSPRGTVTHGDGGPPLSSGPGALSPDPANPPQPTPLNDSSSRQSEEMVRPWGAITTEARPSRSRGTNGNGSAAPSARTTRDEEPNHEETAATATAESSGNAAPPSPNGNKDADRRQPTIRLYSYQDPNHPSRPSLPFTVVTRTLPKESAIIRVGRYSERDGVAVANPAQPSEAPVGFKSKVVSRKHCEFSYSNNQWHVKDVGSSSGTFLNHMRLSPPSMPSRLYAIRDGDIIQLGVDFKGGEEMIFRCVRIRLECNRAWQQRQNAFNKNTANLINSLGKGADAEYTGCRECSICLGSVLRPYQCLFMAACAHVWHYKCIRRLIHSPEYPMFQCPNCRAYTDLSAEVDDSNDIYEHDGPPDRDNLTEDTGSRSSNSEPEETDGAHVRHDDARSGTREDAELAAGARNLNIHDTEPAEVGEAREDATRNGGDATPRTTPPNDHAEASSASRSPNIDIPNGRQSQIGREDGSSRLNTQTPGPGDTLEDCPLTPRNDLGPLALDSRAGGL